MMSRTIGTVRRCGATCLRRCWRRRPQTYSAEFARLAKAAGVPAIRLHDVRHTAATMLLDSGTTPSATANWLGHDPAITLRVDGHVYDDALAAAGDALLGRSRANGDR
jgi:integrase